MKKLFLLLLVFAIAACSLDDEDNVEYHMEFIPVENAIVPDTLIPGQSFKMLISFKRPNDCHYFDGFFTEENIKGQTIAPQTMVFENITCNSLDTEPAEEVVYNFDFSPAYRDSVYVFMFYKGLDAAGQKVFSETTVPVKR